MSTISSIVSSIYGEQELIYKGFNIEGFNTKPIDNSKSTLPLSDPLDTESENSSLSNNELSDSEYSEIQDLQTIDRKVHAHELAHISVGGRFAGGASYEYEIGPDNRQYAVAGEVPIALITGDTPQETIINMNQIIAAALAPADPSSQDRGVASSANSYIQKAVAEIYSNSKKVLFQDNSKLNQYTFSLYA